MRELLQTHVPDLRVEEDFPYQEAFNEGDADKVTVAIGYARRRYELALDAALGKKPARMTPRAQSI